MSERDLEIAELLASNLTYDKIAKKLHVAPKRISKVRKRVEKGSIKVEDGKAFFVEGFEDEAIPDEKDEVMPLVYQIMRTTGTKTPKAGLQQALNLIVKMNPYLIYHKIKPEELISRLEKNVAEWRDHAQKLEEEVEEYRNEDEYDLAKRLGIPDDIIAVYNWFCREKGFEGTLANFFEDVTVDFFKSRNIRLYKTLQGIRTQIIP